MSGEPTNENIDNTGNPRSSTSTLENMTNISDILEECHINLALSQLRQGEYQTKEFKECRTQKLKESVVTFTDILEYTHIEKKAKIHYLRARALYNLKEYVYAQSDLKKSKEYIEECKNKDDVSSYKPAVSFGC